MAHYSISQLKSFQTTKYRFLGHERQNKAYAELAKKEKQAVLDKANKASKELDAKVDAVFHKRGGFVFHVISVILAALLLIGGFSFFQPVISFDFDHVLEVYDRKVAENPDIIPDGMRSDYEIAHGLTDKRYSEQQIEEAKERYYTWRTNECELLTGGCMLLVALLICGLYAVVLVASADRSSPWVGIHGIFIGLIIFYILCWIVFVFRGAWDGVDGVFSAIGAILNALLMLIVTPFGAFVFVFRAGYVMVISALLAPLALMLGYIAYAIAHALFVMVNKGGRGTSKEASQLLAKKKAILVNCPKRAEEVYKQIRAKITPNPYKEDYDFIPTDVRNEVDSILHVIETGYARDYVSAKVFLQQQKNHRELVAQRERQHKENMQQNAAMQRAVEANTKAIREASNKEVEVYIYY